MHLKATERYSHDKRQIYTNRNGDGSIDPPHGPSQLRSPRTPSRYADEDNHVDDCRESHGNGTQKQ